MSPGTLIHIYTVKEAKLGQVSGTGGHTGSNESSTKRGIYLLAGILTRKDEIKPADSDHIITLKHHFQAQSRQWDPSSCSSQKPKSFKSKGHPQRKMSMVIMIHEQVGSASLNNPLQALTQALVRACMSQRKCAHTFTYCTLTLHGSNTVHATCWRLLMLHYNCVLIVGAPNFNPLLQAPHRHATETSSLAGDRQQQPAHTRPTL